MTRLTLLLCLSVLFAASQCTPQKANSETVTLPTATAAKFANDSLLFPEKVKKIKKTEAQWRAELSPYDYNVLREKGTERAFTGNLLKTKGKGIYACKACRLPLFSSDTKFDSGTGWPSFWQPVATQYVGEITDKSYGMVRTEVVCNRCDGHLGHVFDDGPAPTGLRYCINSASLQFIEE